MYKLKWKNTGKIKKPHEIQKERQLKERKQIEKLRDLLKKECWKCWRDHTATKCSCETVLTQLVTSNEAEPAKPVEKGEAP